MAKRTKIILSVIVYFFFGVAIFLAVALSKFPANNIKETVFTMIQEQTGVRISARKFTLHFLMPAAELTDVTITPPPPYSNMPVTLKSVTITPALTGVITQTPKGRVQFKGLGGEFDGTFKVSATQTDLNFNAQKIALQEIPGLKRFVPVALSGQVSLTADLSFNPQNFTTLGGKFSLSVDRVGISEQTFFGIQIPNLKISNLTLTGAAAKGLVSFDKGVIGKAGDDLEGSVAGNIMMTEQIDASKLDLSAKFKLSSKVEEAFDLLKSLLGQKNKDGYYAYKVTGTVATPVPLAESK